MIDAHRASGEASPFSQAVLGAAACGIAFIPLAVILTLIAAVFGDLDDLAGIALGFVIYAVFGSLIGLAMGFLVGLPSYLLLNRVGALRLDVFMLLGATAGFAVFAFWTGADQLRDSWPFALGFSMCGAFGSLIFWLAAKRAKV